MRLAPLAALALVLSVPLATLIAYDADALSLDVVSLDQAGCGVDCFGSTITIGLRISNASQTAIRGLSASATGYDQSVVSYNSGSATSDILSAFCSQPTGCLGGVGNSEGSPLVESQANPLGPQVRFFSGLTTAAGGVSNDGSIDPGLDGVIGGSDRQFELIFQVTGPGTTLIDLGVDPAYNDAVFDSSGASIVVPGFGKQIFISSEEFAFVVPETSTALMLGLGLTALSAHRRRT